MFAWAGVDGHQHEAILRAGESGVKVSELPEDVRRGRKHFQDLKNQVSEGSKRLSLSTYFTWFFRS
jgi:hypothetical protein